MVKKDISIKRLSSFAKQMDDIGIDIDDFKSMSYVDVNLLWNRIYGRDLDELTHKGYNRLAHQLTKMHQSDINKLEVKKQTLRDNQLIGLVELEKQIENLKGSVIPTTKGRKKQYFNRIKKLEKEYKKLITMDLDKEEEKISKQINRLKSDDIKQREKVLNFVEKDLSRQMNDKQTKIIKNRLWLRIHRSKMSNKNFEDIVNGLILQFSLDRREALERARLIAKLPKDKLKTQTQSGFITPSGRKIPLDQIKYYKANTPSVLGN